MKLTRVILILIALGFLGVQVYDRMKVHQDEVAEQKTADVKEVFDGLHACEDAIPLPSSKDGWPAYQAAHEGCQRFWLAGKP